MLLQDVAPPEDKDMVAMLGYLCLFEKRIDTRPRTVVAIRTSPRMKLTRVEASSLYTTVDVKMEGCEKLTLTSLYMPHARSNKDPTPAFESMQKLGIMKGIHIIARDLNWTGTLEMQAALNSNIRTDEAVGQRAFAEDRDWKLFTLMMNELEDCIAEERPVDYEDMLGDEGTPAPRLRDEQRRLEAQRQQHRACRVRGWREQRPRLDDRAQHRERRRKPCISPRVTGASRLRS